MWRSLNAFLVRSVPTPRLLEKISSYSFAHSGLKQTYWFQAEVVTLVLMDFPVFWNIALYTTTKDSEEYSFSIFRDVQE
jgi:hypothetical protein